MITSPLDFWNLDIWVRHPFAQRTSPSTSSWLLHQPSLEGYRPLVEDASKYITCRIYGDIPPSSEGPPRSTPNSFCRPVFFVQSTNWSAILSYVDHQRVRNLHSPHSMQYILEWNIIPNRCNGLPRLLERGCTRTLS